MGWTAQPRWDKRNNCYRVGINGVRHSLGSDYAQACKQYAKLITNHGQQGPPEFVPELVGQWLGDASDWARYVANQWAAFEPYTALADLDRDSLNRFAEHLAKRAPKPNSTRARRAKKLKIKGRLSAQTQRHFLSAAIRACRFGFERGYIATMPEAPRLPAIPDNPKDIDDDRLRQLLEVFNKPVLRRAKLLFDFMLTTGCRPTEARLLRWTEVRLRDSQPRIILPPERHKAGHHSGKSRVVFLNADAIEILKDARSINKTRGYVFVSRLGTPYTDNGIYSIFKRAGCTQYEMRHTYLQNACDHFDLGTAAALAGHTDKAMRSIHKYARIRDRRAAEAAVSLASPARRVLADSPPVVEAESKSPRRPQGKTAAKRDRSAKARSA